VKKEMCDFCAEKSAKILKATAFFFFLSFEENFLFFRFFQSDIRGKKQPINFSLLFFFKHVRFILTHALQHSSKTLL